MKPQYKERVIPETKRVFKAWYECPTCEGEVSKGDTYCRHCGVKFT